jgi:hypothetical protein
MLYFVILISSILGYICAMVAAITIFLSTASPYKRFDLYTLTLVVLLVTTTLSTMYAPLLFGKFMYGFSFTFMLTWFIMRHDRLINGKIEDVK